VQEPIICFVRHLSPVGGLLSRDAFDFFIKASPSVAVGKRLEENEKALLKIEIAGVQQPPFYLPSSSSTFDQPGEFLRQLANERTYIKCQLLCRRVNTSAKDDHIAVGRLFYRPRGHWLRSSGLGESLVRNGRANVSSTGLFAENIDYPVVDSSANVKDLQRDTQYIEQLGKAEFQAVQESKGQWSDPSIRQKERELVEEVDFQQNANLLQKLWRRIMKG
jgi:hypothetical protein